MSSYALDAKGQVNVFDAYINDPRGTIPSGFTEVDELLRRGGFSPGTFVLMGGRTRTRKTTTTANLVARQLSMGYGVGLIGLDGNMSNNYLGRLWSVWNGESMDDIEETWNRRDEEKAQYIEWAKNFSIYNGPMRPAMADLSRWLIDCESPSSGTVRPEIVFIDYVSLLVRNKYDGAENQRIHRLIEELQVFTAEHQIVTVALHQVGRLDEGVGLRYHGDSPMSLEGLKYGGEEIADIVFATYRPALDPVGNMEWDQASHFKGPRFTKDDWLDAVQRVDKYRDYTFLQLLKNRPGTKVHERGIPLRSKGEGQAMQVDFNVSAPDHMTTDPGDAMKAYGGYEDVDTHGEKDSTDNDA